MSFRRRPDRDGLRDAARAVPADPRTSPSADPTAAGLSSRCFFAAIPAGSVIGGVFRMGLARGPAGYAVIVCILVWGAAMTGFGVAVGLADRGSESWQQAMLLAAPC